MTVLLILATLIVFLAIDYFYSRKRVAQTATDGASAIATELRLWPDVVAGFRLPENLRYHLGHTWALAESPNLMRLGLDDFAARLIGRMDRLSLPQRGRWVRQGRTLATAYRDNTKAEVVSPMEGMVTNVNEGVLQDPALALRDPYGEGWLVTVQSPDAPINLRNLFSGTLARKWMEEAAMRLRKRLPSVAAAMAQDGGLAVDNLTANLPDQAWTELTREFFLS